MQGFCDSEQTHGNQDDFNAIKKLWHTSGVACLPGNLVHTDETDRKPYKQGGQPTHRALTQHSTYRSQRQEHQAKVLGRSQANGVIGQHRRKQGHDDGGDRSSNKGANCRACQGSPSAAALGHLVAFHRGDHGGGLARRVEQNRGGRTAVHRPIVNAGKENHRCGGVHMRGNRKQHRHGGRRPDPGQDTHRSA